MLIIQQIMRRLLLLILLAVVWGIKTKDVILQYPVKALFSSHVQDYSSNITGDSLVCFQNYEFPLPTVFQAAVCLVPMISGVNCGSIWGSRTLVVRHEGDMEFFKIPNFPPELLMSLEDSITLVATRWMEFQSKKDNWVDPNWIGDELGGRHMTQIAVEPITICARSTNPFGETAHFHASFRHMYVRERDRRLALEKLGYHVLLLISASSIWFLPYLVAFVVAIYAYLHGLKVIMALLGTGTVVLCLTPFMLTKKNRQLAAAYLEYYFNQAQAAEAKLLMRKKKPLFQALFFSSLLLCSGSAAIYMMYHYTVMDRELRNLLLRMNIGISLSWFAFFFCRSFEKFFCDWIWLAMSFMVCHFMEKHVNPLAHVTMQIVVAIISGIIAFTLRLLWKTGDFQTGIEQLLLSPLQKMFRKVGWKIRSTKSMSSFSITRSTSLSSQSSGTTMSEIAVKDFHDD